MQQFQEGLVFAGRYRIVRCIASGGMGSVYEVVHLETERRRALKVMLPHILESPELRERFKREARIAAHVESEFIVDVSDAGVDDATQMPYLVMELLRGEELGKRLGRAGRFSPADAVTYLRQVALALDKTHRASIVHRDLKPENLYLTESEEGLPRIKILDFGVAKLVAENATNEAATRSLGTPLYMAPEQFLTHPITGAADIYALGLLAYTFLVGASYWEEESRAAPGVIAFGMIAVHGPRERATSRAVRRGARLPQAFDVWFAKATAVNPGDRYPTATAAVNALAEALREDAVSAPASNVVTQLLPTRPPSSPEIGAPDATQLLPPSLSPSPVAGSPITPSAPMSALGVTMPRASRNRGTVLIAVTAGLVVFLGITAAFLLLLPKAPASARSEPPTGESAPLAPPSAPASSALVAAAPEAAPSAVAPEASAEPTDAASANIQASASASAAPPPPSAVPDAGSKGPRRVPSNPTPEYQDPR